MKIYTENMNGITALVIQSQTEAEAQTVDRLKGAKLIAANADSNGYRRVRIMPDLREMIEPKKSEYDGKSVDDLTTLAVQKGVPVQKGTLRQDLVAILETADEDIEAAKEIASKARPAVIKKKSREVVQAINAGGQPGETRTYNATE